MGSFTIADYLARSGAGDSTIATYRRVLSSCESHLSKPLAEASGRDVERLKVWLRGKRTGPSYAAELRRFYRKAGRPELAEICVLKQRVRRLSPDEILTLPDVNAILEAADSLRDRALIATLWGTGQRVGAVSRLELRDLADMPNDNGAAAMRVAFRIVKVAGQEHVSFLLDRDGGGHLRAWLRAYPRDRTERSPVFPSYSVSGPGGFLSESALVKIVQRAAARAGLRKRVYPHLFRHSRATHLLRLGMNPVEVKKLLGWNLGSNVLERRYAHLVDRDAYRELLRVNGLEVPDAEDLGKLAAAEGELRPVVPIVASPGRKGSEDPAYRLGSFFGEAVREAFLKDRDRFVGISPDEHLEVRVEIVVAEGRLQGPKAPDAHR